MRRICIALVFCFTVFLVGNAFGQQWEKGTNKEYFEKQAVELRKEYWGQKKEAEAYALQNHILVTEKYDGGFYVLEKISTTGIPVYRKLYNQEAAQTMNTDLLRPESSLALNLQGEGMTVGIWDGGNFDENHQEFSGRVETRGSISDQPLGLGSDHSTHVAGTIGATGINPAAKGMAPKVFMFMYDFLNDYAEIAGELAKTKPLLVSNHSYGLVLGWQANESGWQWLGDPSVSNAKDYRFGFYDRDNSQRLDQFAFNAPYYLHVRAAGNDRGDIGDGSRPPDGPYDCIGPEGVAKNILTIGAVNKIPTRYTKPEDVVMSTFSSWGPTDDGRVKPDIVAPGVDIFSTFAGGTDKYGTLSGTSMATPATTGSLILLQQHYANSTGGNYMRSSTLKGLVIHTANFAGQNEGPDYEYGWGLLATDKAANVITRRDGKNYIIDEKTLNQGDSIVYTINSDGNAPLMSTICWIDPPGTPAAVSLDPTTPMLVNDLDMRIYDANGQVFKPWILDPSKPDRAATTCDNTRDNVEKIMVKNPAPGNYRVVIKHKGTLKNDKQNVSIIITNGAMTQNLNAFYWIGGSGNWSDGTHWSNKSGGTAVNALPGINNPVFFDDNSSLASASTVTLTGNASCYSINYYASASAKFLLNSFDLNINGLLNIENKDVEFDAGNINFSGSTAKMNFIKAGENAFKTSNLTFASDNGTWNFINNLHTGNISVDNSNFIAKGKTIVLKNFSSANLAGRTIDMSGSSLSGISNFAIDNGANANFDGSVITLDNTTSPAVVNFSGGGQAYHNLGTNNISLILNGDNQFDKLAVNGQLTLNGSNTIDSLSLTSTSSLTLKSGSTQTLKQDFAAQGTASNLLGITADGVQNANLFADNGNIRFCFDYLDISNVSVSGATGFLAGYNSQINANSTGWIAIDCKDALFPSFQIQYPCALGEAKFIDTSTGGPVSWNWNFGDPQFPNENNATVQNPEHQFRFEGDYDITFNVKNAQFDQTITRTITIKPSESDLTVPSINIDGEKLTASVIAPNYQWYRNGQPIASATDRIFNIAQPGLYNVLVSDDQCRFMSEQVTVTGLDTPDKTGGLEIYPNPVASELTLRWDKDAIQGNVSIALFNNLGELVMHQQFNKNQKHTYVVDLKGLPSGLYHLTFNSGSKQLVRKIIKY